MIPRSRCVVLAMVIAPALAACGDRRTSGSASGAPRASAASDAAGLLAAGKATYNRQEFDSARTMFQQATDKALVAADTATLASALRNLGLAWYRLDKYPTAQQFLERAIALDLSARLTTELPMAYNAMGLVAHIQGHFAEAQAAFAHAEKAALAVGDSLTLAKARGNDGMVASDIGDFVVARRGIDWLRQFAHDHGEARLEANALGNLGMVDIRAGDPKGALPVLTVALRMHRANAYAIGEENTLGQLGTAYQAMGQPQLALAYLDSALTIAQQNDLRQQETDDLQLQADVFDESGDQVKALELLTRAASIGDSLGIRKIQGDIARSQAHALQMRGDLRAAREKGAVARLMHADAGVHLEELEDVLLLAELAMRTGNRGEATSLLVDAKKVADLIDSRVARIELALGEARQGDLANDPAVVLKAIARVQHDLAITTTGRAWEAPALSARAYARSGRLPQAAKSGREAVSAVERVRANYLSGPQRATFVSDRAAIYGDLVVSLLRLGKTNEALSVADAARSRALLEHLAAAGKSARRGTAADLAEAEQLLRSIDRLTEQLRVADTVPSRRRGPSHLDEASNLDGRLLTARRQYETLLRRATTGDQRAAALMGSDVPSSTAIRGALESGEAMLEYYVTPDSLITFVLRADGVKALVQPITDKDLSTRVGLARDLVGRPKMSAAQLDPVLSGLFAILVEPARRAGLLDHVRRLIIVPHASLTYLSFAALINHETHRYLVDDFDLLMLPSGASLPAVRSAGSTLPPNAYHGIDVFNPFPTDLPGTRLEGEALRRMDTTTRTFVASAASEQALRAALATTRVVHVATHGQLNWQSPMFSHLQMFRPSTGSVALDDDGRLEVHELLDLSIRSPLVFLSGCETGAGLSWSTSYDRGDDYATLSEAFLFAGARTVVSTLWRIDDRSAALFAEKFHAGLTQGDPVAALAAAQRSMRLNPAYASPYHWAAYVVSGDGRAPLAQNRGRPSVQ